MASQSHFCMCDSVSSPSQSAPPLLPPIQKLPTVDEFLPLFLSLAALPVCRLAHLLSEIICAVPSSLIT